MSHEKVKSLRVMRYKIVVNSACNNIRPLIYETWEVPRDNEHMRNLFRDLCGYCMQPQASANGGRWKWIMRHPCMKNGWYLGREKPDYWNAERDGEFPTQEQLEKDYCTFLRLVDMPTPKIRQMLLDMHHGQYILQGTEESSRPGWYIVRYGHEQCLRLTPDPNRATAFDYYEASELERHQNLKKILLQ